MLHFRAGWQLLRFNNILHWKSPIWQQHLFKAAIWSLSCFIRFKKPEVDIRQRMNIGIKWSFCDKLCNHQSCKHLYSWSYGQKLEKYIFQCLCSLLASVEKRKGFLEYFSVRNCFQVLLFLFSAAIKHYLLFKWQITSLAGVDVSWLCKLHSVINDSR